MRVELAGAMEPTVNSSADRVRYLAVAALVLVMLGLFARIMTYPVGHDEQMFLPAAALLQEWSIYKDLGFNHLPNLPLILNAVLTAVGADHLLLTGRIVIFLCWILAGLIIALIARRVTDDPAAIAFGLIFLAADPILQGQTGMLVTNSLMPITCALAGLYAFLAGLDGLRVRPWLLFASGLLLSVAVGLRVSYVFVIPPFAVAAALVPAALDVGRRLRFVVLPLLAGGILGGLPSLYGLVTDPQGFLTHVTGYHTGPHVAFWAKATEPKIMALGEKLLFAEELWMGGTGILIALVVATCVIAGWQAGKAEGASNRFLTWQVGLVAGLVACGIVFSFVPTPSFPQYFILPIPFAIILAVLFFGQLGDVSRRHVRPAILAASVVAAAAGLPRLLADIPKLATPAEWTPVKAERLGDEIAAQVGRGRIATLAPIYALEAGLDVYPELGAGPFIYRVADLMPAADRRHYRLVSPATLSAFLDANPPAGILVGLEGELDAAFVDYAISRGYVRAPLRNANTRHGTIMLYVPPVKS